MARTGRGPIRRGRDRAGRAARWPWQRRSPGLGWVKYALVYATCAALREAFPPPHEDDPFLTTGLSQQLVHAFEGWAPEWVVARADALDDLIAGLSREPAACRRDGHLAEIRRAVAAAMRREDRLRAKHGLPPLAALLPVDPRSETAAGAA